MLEDIGLVSAWVAVIAGIYLALSFIVWPIARSHQQMSIRDALADNPFAGAALLMVRLRRHAVFAVSVSAALFVVVVLITE